MPRKRKISDDDVAVIRKSREKLKALANRYGVTEAYISFIRKGTKRTNVDMAPIPAIPDYRENYSGYIAWRDGIDSSVQ